MALTHLDLDEKYNNHVITKQYYELLDSNSKKKPLDQLMKPNWINMMKVRVESAKKVMESDGDLHPKAKEALVNYEVLEVTSPDGVTEKKLFLKPTPGVLREIIPFPNTFPYVMKAHIATNHGAEKNMSEWLAKENLAVSHFCLPTILQVCKDCAGKYPQQDIETDTTNIKEIKVTQRNEITDVEFCNANNKYKGYVQVTDMNSFNQNGNLNTLLTYHDLGTGFVQLRPVSSSDILDSVSTELTHIFSDMSPPKCLMVHKRSKDLFTSVVARLNSIFSTVIVMEITNVPDFKLVAKVQAMIRHWLTQTDNCLWCIGCYAVQWELNNIRGADGKSPFERVFGRSVDKSVVKSSVFKDESILNSLNDLQINSEIDNFIANNSVLNISTEVID